MATVRPRQLLALLTTAALSVGLVTSPPTPVGDTTPTASAATAGPKVGELPGKRTATSSTRRLEDGRLRTSVHANPINFRDRDGAWKQIDSTLVEDVKDGFRWRNAANSFTSRFKSGIGEDFLSVEIGDKPYRLSALDIGASTATTSGSRIRFDGARPGADYVYDIGATGVKETIILNDAQAPTSYRFRLSTPPGPRTTARELENGAWAFATAPAEGPLFVLEAPTVSEASTGVTAVDIVEEAQPRLAVTRDGRNFELVLSIDEGWLGEEGRNFPVAIDPTLTIQTDSQDAYWKRGAGTNNAATLTDKLRVATSDTSVYRSGLVFDLAAIPPGVNVSRAELGLFDTGSRVCPTTACTIPAVDHVLDLHRMSSAWGETTLANDVQFDPVAESSKTVLSADPEGWLAWDTTTVVKSWLSGSAPNFGVLLKLRDESLGRSGPSLPGRRYTTNPGLQPKLDVTYVSDGVDLRAPTSLHSDGADLTWSRFQGPSGAAFERYEVHRAPGSGAFTPSAATLLTTIIDIGTTQYRDTSAAAQATFTYRVVANTAVSNPVTVTLPATGEATLELQPGPAEGKSTYAYWTSTLTNCANYGVGPRLHVGSTDTNRYRSLVAFDLRNIPVGATVRSATLSLWQYSSPNSTPVTVEVHRTLRTWDEGGGYTKCTGDGATWYEATGGQPWGSEGGDYDATVEASISQQADVADHYDDFNLTGLVGRWVAGTVPNNGVVLRLADETLRLDNDVVYLSDDTTISTSLTPRLTVRYADGSAPRGPQVTISDPAGGSEVAGTVNITAAASDDRRVDQVQFRVDGTTIATDATAPYTFSWVTGGGSNGQKALTAVATDDAGNITTSTPVQVTVVNSAPPAATLGTVGPTVAGTVALTATASDDGSVARVEFYADGALIGTPDTTAPYTASWNTLDPALPAYDGPHTLSVKAFDAAGQASDPGAGTAVTATNTTGPSTAPPSLRPRSPTRSPTTRPQPPKTRTGSRSPSPTRAPPASRLPE